MPLESPPRSRKERAATERIFSWFFALCSGEYRIAKEYVCTLYLSRPNKDSFDAKTGFARSEDFATQPRVHALLGKRNSRPTFPRTTVSEMELVAAIQPGLGTERTRLRCRNVIAGLRHGFPKSSGKRCSHCCQKSLQRRWNRRSSKPGRITTPSRRQWRKTRSYPELR